MRRVSHQHFKGFVDIEQTPIAKDAQFHQPIVDGPEGGLSIRVEHVCRVDVQGGDGVLGKHLLYVGTQLVAIGASVPRDITHLLGQLLVETEAGSTSQRTGGDHVSIVDHQILSFHEKIHIRFLPVISQVGSTLSGSIIVVDVSLLEKRNHGFHEPESVHVVEHFLDIVRVKRGHRAILMLRWYERL